MSHETLAAQSLEAPAPHQDALPAQPAPTCDVHDVHPVHQLATLSDDLDDQDDLNPDDLDIQTAESEFDQFERRMKQNPQLARLAFTMLEPHLDDYRQHMQLLKNPGYETEMIPFNWKIGGPAHELAGVTPRVMLRHAMYHITSGLAAQSMGFSQGRKGNPEMLKNLYLAMATARWADEVLNNKPRRAGDKPGLQLPKLTASKRGGARPGAGRPRKNATIRPITDISEDDDENSSDEA
jgi:hypothetical protein